MRRFFLPLLLLSALTACESNTYPESTCADFTRPTAHIRELSPAFLCFDGYAARKTGQESLNPEWGDEALSQLHRQCETRPQARVMEIWIELKKTLIVPGQSYTMTTLACHELVHGSAGRPWASEKGIALWLVGYLHAGRGAAPWFVEDMEAVIDRNGPLFEACKRRPQDMVLDVMRELAH